MINPFFKNSGPYPIETLLKLSSIENKNDFIKTSIFDIKDLFTAKKNDITFFHSKKYADFAFKTKASFCITTKNLSHILPKDCSPIIVDNVLIATAKITKVLYPNSVTDHFDQFAKDIKKTPFKETVI